MFFVTDDLLFPEGRNMSWDELNDFLTEWCIDYDHFFPMAGDLLRKLRTGEPTDAEQAYFAITIA